MLSDTFTRFITSPARILNIIWGAFLAASFLYAAVAWFILAGAEPREADLGMLKPLGAVAALVLAVLSFWYRKRALGEAALLKVLSTPPANPLPGSQELDPVEQRLAALFPYYQTTTVVVLAMREAVAVLGLILAILTGDFWIFVAFGVPAVLLIASQPPAVGAFMERALPLARSAA